MSKAIGNSLYPALWALDQRLWPFQGKVAQVKFSDSSQASLALALDQALQSLTHCAQRLDQWKCFFSPDDIVGIKVNCRRGPGNCTAPALVEAIIDRLLAVGIPPARIIIWDRKNEDLRACGYKLNTASGSVRCFGVEDIFDVDLVESGNVAGRLSMIVSRMCSALISVPVLRHHPVDGIDGCVRNLYDALQNPYKLSTNSAAADFLALEPLRSMWRLAVVDASFIHYTHGKNIQKNALMVAADPMALDWQCMKIINESRATYQLRQSKAPWISAAEEMGLGIFASEAGEP